MSLASAPSSSWPSARSSMRYTQWIVNAPAAPAATRREGGDNGGDSRIRVLAAWRKYASQGQGNRGHSYPPETEPAQLWLAGWRAWDDYLHQCEAHTHLRFRYAAIWWNGGCWNWQECWL